MAYTGLTDPFMLYMKVAFLTAIFVTSPFIFLQVWYFIARASTRRRKSTSFRSSP